MTYIEIFATTDLHRLQKHLDQSVLLTMYHWVFNFINTASFILSAYFLTIINRENTDFLFLREQPPHRKNNILADKLHNHLGTI